MVLLSMLYRFLAHVPCQTSTTSASAPQPSHPLDHAGLPTVVAMAMLQGCLLRLPVCFVVCQLTTRWIVRRKRSRLLSCVIMIFVGDMLLEVWDGRLPLGPSGGFLALLQSPPGTRSGWMQLVCYSATQFDDSLDRQTTLARQAIHFMFMALGAYVGQRFLPVALTGSIATGKSTVAKLLLESSHVPPTTNDSTPSRAHQNVGISSRIRLIDTDSIGHQILLSPARLSTPPTNDTGTRTESYVVNTTDSVFDRVVAAFGDSTVNDKNILNDEGEIDRRKLGDIIFRDHNQRRVLNRITHPRIIRVLLQKILGGTLDWNSTGMVYADVPLLFESGTLRCLFGIVIVVACQPDQQYQRLRQRNLDLTEQQCRDRIASQMPISEKASLANIVVWNDGTLPELQDQVRSVQLDVQDRLVGRCIIFRYLCLAGATKMVATAFGLSY